MLNRHQTIAEIATAAAVPTNRSTIKIATTLIIVSFFMMTTIDREYKRIRSRKSKQFRIALGGIPDLRGEHNLDLVEFLDGDDGLSRMSLSGILPSHVSGVDGIV